MASICLGLAFLGAVEDRAGHHDIFNAEVGFQLFNGELAPDGVGAGVLHPLHDRLAHADVPEHVFIHYEGIGLQAHGIAKVLLGLFDVGQGIGVDVAVPRLRSRGVFERVGIHDLGGDAAFLRPQHHRTARCTATTSASK